MNDPQSALDDVKREAVRWLVRLRADDFSETETLAFADWLSQDYRHSQAFAAAEETFNTMAVVCVHSSQLRGSQTASPRPLVVRHTKAATRHRRWLAATAVAMAAVWLFAVLLVVPGQAQPFADLFSGYHTAAGELRQIELADGSRLLLNTNTAIALNFNAAIREIRLLHGQARFQVAADPSRPFQVVSGDLRVQALGTVFDVYSSADDQTQVVVEEHAVLATVVGGSNDQARAQVRQGQQLQYRRGHPIRPEAVDLTMSQAWQQRQLFINDRPLTDLVNELQRYRVGRIFIGDETLRQQHVTGVFPLEHPDEVLESLDKILGIHSTRLGPWWVVLHR